MALKTGLMVRLACLPLVFGAACLVVDAPAVRADEPAKGDASKADAAKLPATDPKAQAMLKEAWDRAVSLPGQADKPLQRFAADAVCKAEPKGGGWGARAAAKTKMEAKTAYLKDEGADFTIRLLDEKKDDGGGEDGEDWAGMGVKAALSNAVSRFSFALKYIIGVTPFADEFKDATFEMGDAPDKAEKCVKVWRLVLGRPFSSQYFIGDKGKGNVLRVVRDGKVLTYTYDKPGKKARVTKLEFKPEPVPGAEGDKKEEKKEEKKDPKSEKSDKGDSAKKDDGKDAGKGGGPGGRGGPGGGRWPGGGGKGGDEGSGEKPPEPGHETYTFTLSKNIKGYDVFTKIETIGRYLDNAIPVTFTLSNLVTNEDATDQKIADGGCGKKGEVPGIDGYKKSDAAKKDGDAPAKKEGDAPAKKDDGKVGEPAKKDEAGKKS